MKRDFFLLAAVLLLSVTALAAGHIGINSQKNKLEIEEQILLGDPAALGLTATYNARDSGRHLLWNTTFTPGQTEQAETEFWFNNSIRERTSSDYSYAALSTTLTSQHMSRAAASGLDFLPDYLRAPIDDVASRTPAGEERTETLRMADYYDDYPLLFEASQGGCRTGASKSIEQYFRLKMDERVTAEITVHKYRDGSVSTWDVSIPDNRANLLTSSAITSRGIYFTAKSMDGEGKQDSRLQCRDGQGIHFIPAVPAEENWFDASQIRLFYPTGTTEILQFQASPDESRLLLYTREADMLVLAVIDAVSGEALQRLELMELGPEEEPSVIEDGALRLAAVWNSGKFCLTEEENGVYTNVLSGVIDAPQEVNLPHIDSLAWDGERMAFAHEDILNFGFRYSHPYILQNPAYIGAVDAEGLCCLAYYSFSINRDPSQQEFPSYGSDKPALTVAFAEK